MPKILPPDLKTFVYFFFAHPLEDQYNEESVQEHQESREDQEGKFRPVIIDGCNVGHTYGQNKYPGTGRFSAMGLWIAYQYFKKLGYENEDIIIVQRHI